MIETAENIFRIRKKSISLRKSIALIVLVGYCTLLILLMLLDFFLVNQYQMGKREQESIPLKNCVDKIRTEMDVVKKIIYDVYVFDGNFLALSGKLDSAEKFSNAYDLRQSLKGFMAVDNDLHGFYIFYDANEAPLYHVNTDGIAGNKSSQLGNELRRLTTVSGDNRISGWITLEIEKELYLIESCYKGNVSLFGVLNIDSIINKLLPIEQMKPSIILTNSDKPVGTYDHHSEDKMNLINQMGKDDYLDKDFSRIYRADISGTDISIYALYPARFDSYMNGGQAFLLALTALSVFLAIWIVSVLRKNLIVPLRELCVEMQNIREEKQSNTYSVETCFYELQEVNETLHDTIDKLEKQKLISYEHYIEKQKAQMQYLQLQIQPHFYLNGLKVINGLVLKGDVEKTQSYIISLSEHLRYLMQVDSEVTTLTKEIEFTKNYVYLRNQMSLRIISLTIEQDSELKDCIVPTLLIQTFVDNSIKHAKFGSPDLPLDILVRLDLLHLENESMLDLQVYDNGNGYDEEILKLLNEEPKPGEKHIGISNLKRRCRLMYGEKAEFSFSNNNGAISECIIPLRENK